MASARSLSEEEQVALVHQVAECNGLLRSALRRCSIMFFHQRENLAAQAAEFWFALGQLNHACRYLTGPDLIREIKLVRNCLGEPQAFSYHAGCRDALAEVYVRFDLLIDALGGSHASPTR